MTFISLAVFSALCLVFASTRKYAVFGVGALLFLWPEWTLASLGCMGPAFFYFRHYIRRKFNGRF